VRYILEVVEKCLKETAELEFSVNNIGSIASLGRRRDQWPILVKCIMSLAMHLQVLRKTNLVGLRD
jgi:hypothetical protein